MPLAHTRSLDGNDLTGIFGGEMLAIRKLAEVLPSTQLKSLR